MPKSRLRRKSSYTAPPTAQAGSRHRQHSPAWLVPLMLALFLVGIAWIVVFYISEQNYPVPSLGQSNLLVGFGFILGGFGLSTQWR